MIKYKGVLEKLQSKGYSSYRLRKEHLLSESTLQYIREGKPVSVSSIDTICSILDCPIEDILEYVKDQQ